MEGGFLNNYHCDIYKDHEICFKNFNYKDLTQKKKEYIEDQSCKLAIENPKLAYIDIYLILFYPLLVTFLSVATLPMSSQLSSDMAFPWSPFWLRAP